MVSKNGAYTGGLITTRSPGSVATSSTSKMPHITSGTTNIRAGSSSCRQRRAAKAAYASANPSHVTYPVSPRSTSSANAARMGSARRTSISATHNGSTSGSLNRHLTLRRCLSSSRVSSNTTDRR